MLVNINLVVVDFEKKDGGQRPSSLKNYRLLRLAQHKSR